MRLHQKLPSKPCATASFAWTFRPNSRRSRILSEVEGRGRPLYQQHTQPSARWFDFAHHAGYVIQMALENGAFVDMVHCSKGAYYVGIYRGFDLETRIGEHNSGHYTKAWTYRRRPVKLVWAEHFDRVTDAIECETRIKKWSRAKKEALIVGDYARISELAKSHTSPADPTKRRFTRYTD